MVDFNKKIRNSSKFLEAARFFLEHGCYTLAPRGTTDYIQYWDRETERCLNGYVAPDGDAITGYHYFYLNYSPIIKRVDTKYTDKFGNVRTRRERKLDFPEFWDGDYYFFNACEEAELQGKHLAVLKARKKGFSFKGSSMLVRNYTLVAESKNFAIASELKFLVGDGLLTKAWEIMDFVDRNTEWSKRRLTSTRMERVSGFKVKDEFGKETEDGYKSAITGVTLKNDVERIRGIRGKLVLFEEGGKFPNLETAWRVAQPSMEDDDGTAFGLMIVFGTGGTEGAGFDGLKTLFYNPKAFNVLEFPNIWDDNASETSCGYFSPIYLNMEGFDENGNYKYMDSNGNSLVEIALLSVMQQRNDIKDGGASQLSIDRFISERPIKPQEAVLELGKNIFPRKLLMDQLTRIRTNKKLQNMKHIVDLKWDGDGKVLAVEKKSGDITTYHLKRDDKPEGSIVIWEYPIVDPPFGLYIGGCLTPGEKVITQRGLVNVEDVTLDDKLINKDGVFVKINTLLRYDKENEDVYTVKMSNFNRTTTFTAEHPLYTWNPIYTKQNTVDWDKQEYKFTRMKFVLFGDFVQMPNVYYNTNNDVQTPVEAKDLWWFVGLWLGDGWCSNDGYKIYVSFDVNLIEYFEKCKQFVEQQLNRSTYSRIRNNSIELSFCCKELNNWLTNTFGKYAHGKHIPDNVKRISKLKKLQLLRGYLDSDGCLYVNQTRNVVSLEWVSISQELLEDIQDVCFGVGIISSLTKLRNKKQAFICNRKVSLREAYHLRISTTLSLCLVDMLLEDCDYADIKLNKAKDSGIYPNQFKPNSCFLTNNNTTIVAKIKTIEVKKYTGIVYNFDCDTHTFMCRGILTHNCDPLTQKSSGFKIEQKR